MYHARKGVRQPCLWLPIYFAAGLLDGRQPVLVLQPQVRNVRKLAVMTVRRQGELAGVSVLIAGKVFEAYDG